MQAEDGVRPQTLSIEVAKREDGAKYVLPFHDWTFPRGSKVDLRRRDERRGGKVEAAPSVTTIGGCWGLGNGSGRDIRSRVSIPRWREWLPWMKPWDRRRRLPCLRKRAKRRSLISKVIVSFFVQRVLPCSSPLAQFQQTHTSIVVLNLIGSEPFLRQSATSCHVFIEVCLEPLEDTHVVPLGQRRLMGRIDGLAPVVEDDVILWTDIAGCQVLNEADGFAMHWRIANKLPVTRTRLPAR